MLLPLHDEFMYIYLTVFWPPGPLDQSQKVNLDEKHKFVISPTNENTQILQYFIPKFWWSPSFLDTNPLHHSLFLNKNTLLAHGRCKFICLIVDDQERWNGGSLDPTSI